MGLIKRTSETIMRMGIAALTILLLVSQAAAQKPIKTDLMPFFDKVTAPPQSCSDAFQKGICSTGSGNVQCDSKKLFEDINTQLDGFMKQINSGEKFTPTDDQAKVMEEIKKKGGADKIKKMSKEEKMKMAMDMMKNMGTPQTHIETEETKDCFAKQNELNQFMSKKVQDDMANYKAMSDSELAVKETHNQVDEWKNAEIKKLPQYSSGEMSAPDPKEVKRVNLEAAEKHIKLADIELKKIAKQWAELKMQFAQPAKLYCESLVKCKYGDAVQNKSWLNLFGLGQGQVITLISELAKRSAEAYNYGAKYYADKVAIEKGN
jgi:hypothetical protein